MERDYLEPFERLIPVKILGRAFEVPANNTILRVLQYLELERKVLTMDYRDLCWNQECDKCRIRYRKPGETEDKEGYGCTIKAFPGMEIQRLPPSVRIVTNQTGQSATEYALVTALTMTIVLGLAKLAQLGALAVYLWSAAHLLPPYP